MNQKYLTGCGFDGVSRVNKNLRPYQFGYVSGLNNKQVMLPCPMAFSIPGRKNWVLTHDQMRDILAQDQPEAEEEENPEQQQEQEQEQHQHQHNLAWEGQP